MAKHRYDEDLFKDTTMTFGEHLEELRGALLRASAGLVLGLVVGLLVGRQAVAIIQAPLESALQRYLIRRSLAELEQKGEALSPEETELIERQNMVFDDYQFEPQAILAQLRRHFGLTLPNPLTSGPLLQGDEIVGPQFLAKTLVAGGTETADTPARRLWQHLTAEQQALVTRLVQTPDEPGGKARLAEALSAALADPALFRIAEPGDAWPASGKRYLERLREGDSPDAPRWNRAIVLGAFPLALEAAPPPLATLRLWRSVIDDPRTRSASFGVTEPFMIYLKASLVVGATLASPIIFWQIWAFVAAGLYPHERRYVHLFGPVSLGLFALGVATVFLFVFQPVLDYLFWFNEWLGIDPDPRINEWLSFVLFLPLGFGIAFQLPLVMLFLERIGIFSVEQYIGNWRIAVIAIVVLSAVLTPADPWSMFFMAVPLVFLYGLGLLMCWYLPQASEE
jgi:sec-independent protein translocase protein TatC